MVSREFVATSCICCGGTNLQGTPAVLMPFVAFRVFRHEPVEITAEWGMRDLKEGWSYTLCRTLECLDCGAVFLDYRFTDEQMSALYAGYRDEAYVRDRVRFEPGYAGLVESVYSERHAYLDEVEKWLIQFVPANPKVLDFGGSDGMNSPLLGIASAVEVHDISGVELVQGASRANPATFGNVHYDLVSCVQTLEHVAYPLETLQQLLPALDDASLLYVEVPYEDLMVKELPFGEAGVQKKHWHEHINFYSRESMLALLKRAGLEVVAEHRQTVDIGYGERWIQGFLAKLVQN